MCVSSVTAVALDNGPAQLAGMASATTNIFRDLGFALGSVVVGAVALRKAVTAFSSNLDGADLPTDHLGAVRADADHAERGQGGRDAADEEGGAEAAAQRLEGEVVRCRSRNAGRQAVHGDRSSLRSDPARGLTDQPPTSAQPLARSLRISNIASL